MTPVDHFQVVARVVRWDSRVAVHWNGPGEIVMTIPAYRGNFLLSSDLRTFDTRLRPGDTLNIQTPLGLLRAETVGSPAELTLTLTPKAQRERVHLFCYSDGQIKPLKPRQ